MLVLTRTEEDSIMIGDDIEIKVLEIRGGKVKLGLKAPLDIIVDRKEVYLEKKAEREAAAHEHSNGTAPD